MKNLPVLVCLCLALWAAPAYPQDNPGDSTAAFPLLSGDYLGQQPPGMIPELFAPGIISTAAHRERDVSFSRDMREFYFSRDATIMVMKQENGRWSAPQPASFSAEYAEFEAFLAPDGQRLYYISNRPLSGAGEREPYQMWMVERQAEGWGPPVRFTELGDFYPTITNDGVMYFTSADNDLYRTKLINGYMAVREKLGDSVNTAADEYNSCIAPDGSFLIFTSSGWGDGFGGGDLFISFRKPDGSFGHPRNMGGGINSGGHDYCPSISPDGKYLFFASNINGNDDIFWVDAAIIDVIRTRDLNTADMLYNTVISDGIPGGLAKYEELKAAYSDYCLFDGWLLSAVADRLLGDGQIAPAIALFNRCFELYPQTLTLAQRLKLAVIKADETELAVIADELRSEDPQLKDARERGINALGYRLLAWGRTVEAVRLFRFNTELYPHSFNVFDSYGEGLLAIGDTAAAIVNYKKSLELNAENRNAVAVLERLSGN